MCGVGQQCHRVGGEARANANCNKTEIEHGTNGKCTVTMMARMAVVMMMMVVVLHANDYGTAHARRHRLLHEHVMAKQRSLGAKHRLTSLSALTMSEEDHTRSRS